MTRPALKLLIALAFVAGGMPARTAHCAMHAPTAATALSAACCCGSPQTSSDHCAMACAETPSQAVTADLLASAPRPIPTESLAAEAGSDLFLLLPRPARRGRDPSPPNTSPPARRYLLAGAFRL